jgi:acyl-CoA synthetase (AMP-forming)/AMP-acid ligase II
VNFAEQLLRPEHADRVALAVAGRTVTYAALRAAVESWAGRMQNEGLPPGGRVAILADNSVFAATAYLATLYAGGVAVPLSPSSPAASLAAQFAMSGARLVCAERRYAERLLRGDAGPVPPHVWLDAEGRAPWPDGWSVVSTDAGAPTGRPAASRSANDLAVINFTSGSTGAPRGVMVSHGNLDANTRSIVEYLALTRDDRALLVLPLYYCFGASVLHSHLAVGGSVAISGGFAYPEKVLDELAHSSATGFYGVPSTFQVLLRRSTFKARSFPSLRYMAQAGGRLAPVFVDEIRAAFPSVPFVVMYGQTEATARLSYLPPQFLDTRNGSIGRGIPGVDLRVLRADGQPVAPGELGEIVARGANITLGYLDDPAATATYFRDGALWTGDLAVVDDEGFIYVRDRQRDFIKSGGQRIGSKEVEDTIAELPDVVEVAVVGVPHETLGEAIAAHVVVRRGASVSADDVIRHCRARLGSEREPRVVEFKAELPKNESGKIMKAALRAGVWQNVG